MNNTNTPIVADAQNLPSTAGLVESSKPHTSNKIYIPLLLGVIALLVIIIGILLATNLKNTPSSPDAKPTPTTEPVTVYSPIPTIAVTTAPTTQITGTVISTPVASVTPIAEVAWKDFSFTVRKSDYQAFTVSGSYPADSTMKNNDPEFTMSNSKYSLKIATAIEGEIVHYNSYKALPRHVQFGEIFRVRMNDISNNANYVIGPVTKTGECAYIQSMIQAPCGSDIAVANGKYAFNITCVATLSNRDSICDKIVDSIRVK